MKRQLFAIALATFVSCLSVSGQDTPVIQFEQTAFDFGKVTGSVSVSGTFKLKNTGTGMLKLGQPTTSCGCTVAVLKKDTFNPGETGELAFTLNLGTVKSVFEKQIVVTSNDAKSPSVTLTVKADYTPLYEIDPIILSPTVTRGDVTNFMINVTRTDGKAVNIPRVETSKPWITAKFDSGEQSPSRSSSRLRVEVKGDGPLGQINETVSLYADETTNMPVSMISLIGQITGEVTFSPEMIYWRITDRAKAKAEISDSLMSRRVLVRRANGKEFELKNIQSSLKAVNIEVLPRESGKACELVITLTDIPESTATGVVTFTTSVTTQPKVEIPVTISVVWQPPPLKAVPISNPAR